MNLALPIEGGLPAGIVTPVQERLLRIIYGPEADAPALFEEWQAGIDMADLDDGCYRLYPYLYRRVRGFAPEHPFLGRMKGLFRRALYRNHLLFEWAGEIVDRLRAEGIDCIVLKGAAIVRSIGISAGFRPMADVDLLVRLKDVRRALAVADPRFRALLADSLLADAHVDLHHGFTVLDDRRLEIDLHWRLSGTWAAGADPDAPFWESAQTVELLGRRVLALAPTELLYHVLVHGLPRNSVPTIRWISDALDILAAEEAAIDWPRLAALGRRYEKRPFLWVGLGYIRRNFQAAVPQSVMDELGPPYGATELAGFRMQMLDWRAPVPLGDARILQEERFKRVEERHPGRRKVIYLNDAMASPEALAWIRSVGADHVCEFSASSATVAAARALVLGTPDWKDGLGDGRTALYRLDNAGGGVATPPAVFATVRQAGPGRWEMRAFHTSLADWPVGAAVYRLDVVYGFQNASFLGADSTLPFSFLPVWPGFFSAPAFTRR